METDYDKAKKAAAIEIRELSEKFLSDIMQDFWIKMFDDKVCVSHVEGVPRHVKLLYDEIVNETKERITKIETYNKKLLEKASQLKQELSSEINLTPNLPLYPLKIFLETSVCNLKKERERRKIDIKNMSEEQDILCKELGECPMTFKNSPNLPTQDNLNALRKYLNDLIIEKQARHAELIKLRNEINELVIKLDTTIEDPKIVSIMNDSNPKLIKSNELRLKKFRDELNVRFNSMKEDIDTAKADLESLRELFESEVNESVTNKFEGVKYTHEFLREIVRELNHWKQKQEKIFRDIVTEERIDIMELWTKLFYSEEEKARFTCFTSNLFTEELLIAHKMELKYLRDLYFENNQIFNLVEELHTCWSEQDELETRADDPNRLYNRGGQLLHDAKKSKDVSYKLFKIEKEISVLAATYQKRTNKPFTVDGQLIAEYIEARKQHKKLEYQEKMQNRRQFLSPLPKVKSPNAKPKTGRRLSDLFDNRSFTSSSLSNRLLVPNPIQNRSAGHLISALPD